MIKKLFISLSTIILSLIIIIQFPNLFVKKQIEYKPFIIYSNDDIVLNKDVKNILDAVQINLKESQFYQDDLMLELYFVQNTFYAKLLRLFGMHNIASSKFNKHIYIGKPDFKENILRGGDSNLEWLNLVQIISHESVHSQMYEDFAFLGFMKTPSWINEGYAEYISYRPVRKDSIYNLSKVFERYTNNMDHWVVTEFNSMTPHLYLRDRIIIEYLIDEKGLDIFEIINDTSLSPEQIINEVDVYYSNSQQN